jgi:P-type E1-E2 ATPase
VLWEDISIGDIVQLSDNDTIPCDMVILSTSQEQNQCYVQTSNLDGETSLKTKVASPPTKKLKSINMLNQFLGKTSTETTQTSSNKSTIDVSFQVFFYLFSLLNKQHSVTAYLVPYLNHFIPRLCTM